MYVIRQHDANTPHTGMAARATPHRSSNGSSAIRDPIYKISYDNLTIILR